MLFPLRSLSPPCRYFSLQNRCKSIQKHFESKKDSVDRINSERRVSKDLLLPLRSLGCFGLGGALAEGGQGLGMTESLRVTEEFGVNLSVSRDGVCRQPNASSSA